MWLGFDVQCPICNVRVSQRISFGPLTNRRRLLDSEWVTGSRWQQLGLVGLIIRDQISTKLSRRSELADETLPAFGPESAAVGFTTSTQDIQIDRSARPIIRAKPAQHAASYCHGVCSTEISISCAVASDGYQPVKIGIVAEQLAWQIGPMGNGSPFHRTLHGVSPWVVGSITASVVDGALALSSYVSREKCWGVDRSGLNC
jgi:hypothetical protein